MVLTFPVFPPVNGQCGCGQASCSAKPGKHPAIRGWSQIAESVPGRDGFNTGVLTGAPSGIVVVDEDIPGAADGLGLPPTLTVSTHAGRTHRYYRHPGFYVKSKAYWPGVDVKGDGGFVLAPGSVHASGAVYTILSNPGIANLPEAILMLLQAQNSDQTSGVIPTAIGPDHPQWERRIRDAVGWVQDQEPSVSGSGGHGRLFAVACKLVRYWELPEETSLAILERFFNPRCSPPWSQAELLHKLWDGATSGDEIPGGCDLIYTLTVNPGIQVPIAKDAEWLFVPGDAVPKGVKNSNSDVVYQLRTDADWFGVLAWNELKSCVQCRKKPPLRLDAWSKGKWTGADTYRLRCLFELSGRKIDKEMARDAVREVASGNPFHPVREYLEALSPGQPGAIAAMGKALGLQTAIEMTLLRRFLIGAVERVYKPGCQMDGMLVLFGEQYAGKSTFVKVLFGEWTREGLPDVRDSVRAAMSLRGFWGIEVGELAAIASASNARAKDFITTWIDTYRAPYAEDDESHPRRCVFIATTNESQFLNDATGDRRYWILRCARRIDIATIRTLRDAAWSEALTAFQASETHHIQPDEELARSEVAAPFRESDVDPWSELIRDMLCGVDRVSTNQILARLEIPKERQTRIVTRRIGKIVRDLGGSSKKVHGLNWFYSGELENQDPSPDEQTRRIRIASVAKLNTS